MPWLSFAPPLERAFIEERHESLSRLDKCVAVPWAALWLSILWRHWHAMTAQAVMRSFCHFMVIISPSYLQLVLGRRAYLQHRVAIIGLALTSYVLHPGGGLYRDAMMQSPQDSLAALSLFVRLLVGSRTLFWLVLSFGYRLPPHTLVPLHGALLALKALLKPSQPFCAVLQTVDTQPLFQAIAINLPLVSLTPLDRPTIKPGADICNPLHAWIVFGLGLALPAAVSLVRDFEARQRFVRRHAAQLQGVDRERWLSKTQGSFAPAGLAALVWVHFMTALWYGLMYRQMQLPSSSEVSARYAAHFAGAASAGE
ncbi:hypothetical protein CHLNCDRAFT_143565 [Chlorella variabilis]|uniref:Uncharacterized protein n=1 Tax=Chlorella variabilis TaxID=554065 RepID=E1ZB69_CHLVA|nr:hypothetical protein CHLNCDRAFT_143565 [Chlorella variabilis]EFN56972.1 hypothetical protein CHLNCDRAFT_143565 [Chlorella variabilis]|eukprot:XP_005849074.1 hypothetical protein CHLNCDRAFT_143565 [Chlorella variabilis]